MTRHRPEGYSPAEDPFAVVRCACGHLFYADDQVGNPCRYAGLPGGGSGKACECTSHAPKGVPDAHRS